MVSDEPSQANLLVGFQYGNNDEFFLMRVRALGLVEGRALMQFLDDEFIDRGRIVTDDVDHAAPVQSGNGCVDQHRLD